MPNALVRKLRHSGCLTDEDQAVLISNSYPNRTVDAASDLSRDGDRPENAQVILRGIAYRYKLLPGGRRQITAVFVPGDFCNLHAAVLDQVDHSIATLTPCTVVHLSHAAVHDLTVKHPRIARALWWATLVDEAILRAWLVNMGQRAAPKQVAHFFCELEMRLAMVGLSSREEVAATYDMPFRQTDLADLFGMTAVHLNRTLQDLRGTGLIVLEHRRLHVPDIARLRAYCGFDPSYLHLKASDFS